MGTNKTGMELNIDNNGFVSGITTAIDKTKEIADVSFGAAQKIAEMGSALAGIFDKIGVFSSISEGAKTAMGDIEGAIDNGLNNVFLEIAKTLKSADLGAFDELVTQINSVISQIVSVIDQGFGVIISYIPKLMEPVMVFLSYFQEHSETLIPIITALVAAFLTVGTVVVVLIKVAETIATVKASIDLFKDGLKLVSSPMGIAVLAIMALAAVAILVYENWETISEFLSNLWTAIKDKVVAIFTAIVDFFKKWGGTLLSILGGPIGIVVGLIIRHWDTIKAKTIAAFNAVANFLGDCWNSIVGFFQGGVDKVAVFIDKMIGVFNIIKEFSLVDAGKAIIDGFVNGLKAAWEAGKKFVSGIGDWIKDHKGPISYDKRLLVENGQSIMFGLDKGLQNGFGDVMSNVNGMSHSISASFTADASQSNTATTQPAQFVVNIGKQNFTAFVADISDAMGGETQINMQI